jgi:hypothetical protein
MKRLQLDNRPTFVGILVDIKLCTIALVANNCVNHSSPSLTWLRNRDYHPEDRSDKSSPLPPSFLEGGSPIKHRSTTQRKHIRSIHSTAIRVQSHRPCAYPPVTRTRVDRDDVTRSDLAGFSRLATVPTSPISACRSAISSVCTQGLSQHANRGTATVFQIGI